MPTKVTATIPVGIQYAKIDVECESISEAIHIIKTHNNCLKESRITVEGDPFWMKGKDGKTIMWKKTDEGFVKSLDGGVTWIQSTRIV